jgi:hypothetical protein
MSSSYRELQTIYETYPLRSDPGPNRKFYPPLNNKNTFLGYPGSSPSGEGMPTTSLVASEEEEHGLVDALKQQLNQYMAEADDQNMQFAKSRFFSLLQTIDKYNK